MLWQHTTALRGRCVARVSFKTSRRSPRVAIDMREKFSTRATSIREILPPNLSTTSLKTLTSAHQYSPTKNHLCPTVRSIYWIQCRRKFSEKCLIASSLMPASGISVPIHSPHRQSSSRTSGFVWSILQNILFKASTCQRDPNDRRNMSPNRQEIIIPEAWFLEDIFSPTFLTRTRKFPDPALLGVVIVVRAIKMAPIPPERTVFSLPTRKLKTRPGINFSRLPYFFLPVYRVRCQSS